MEELKNLYDRVVSFGPNCSKYTQNQAEVVMQMCRMYNQFAKKNEVTCKVCAASTIRSNVEKMLRGHGLI